jgi:hypothetical protein
MIIFQWMRLIKDLNRFGFIAAALGTNPLFGRLSIGQYQALKLMITLTAFD